MPEPASNSPIVTLFGPLEIRTGEVVTSQFRSNRVKALLVYLLLSPRGARREVIADRLWPNLDEAAARNNLRVTLQYLKQSLAAHNLEGAIISDDRSRLAIDCERITTDVDAFRRIVKQLREDRSGDVELLERALALACAPLTPGLYDEWLDPHRGELNQERYAILVRLAKIHLDQKPARALELARTAAEEHPFLCEPREIVAEALIRLGEPATAIAELTAYEKDLASEIGGTPSPAIAGLIKRAAAASAGLDTPASRSINLPSAFTRFFGRESELLDIRNWAADPEQRLLTIFGPGGVGKTRLASEAAKAIAEQTLVWVEAEAVTTGEALLEQIARTASPVLQAADPIDRLKVVFRRDPAIVVLDNVEQIPDRELLAIDKLLRSVPMAKVLATSRRTLGFAGERLLRIEPLSPSGEAVELFLDRARACRPDFPGDPESLDRVKEVCNRVEGIPLAIELAAARLISVSISELASGMEKPLDILVARRSPDSRHGAMRRTIEWSFSQLNQDLRERILSLGILQSSWTAAAAGALFAAGGEIAPVLETAVENSLLSVAQTGGKTRYRMLECVREYCHDALPPLVRDSIRRKAASYYRSLAGEVRSFEQIDADWPNIEAAIRTLVGRPDTLDEGLDLCASVLPFLGGTANGAIVLTILEEAEAPDEQKAKLYWLRSALQLSGSRFTAALRSASDALELADDEALKARLLVLRARALLMEGNIDMATQEAEAAIALTASTPDLLRRDALLTAAKALYNRHENQRALELTEEARRITWQQRDTTMYPELLDMQGLIYNRLGDFEKSEQMFRMILDPAQGAPLYRLARTWGRLGEISLLAGEIAAAIARFETGLEFARKSQDNWALAQILVHLGESLLKMDRLDAAAEAFTEAMQIRLIAGERLGLGACLQGLARVHLARGDLREAVRVFQEGIRHCREIPDHRLLFRLLTSCACALDEMGDTETAKQYAHEVMAMLREGRAEQTEREIAEVAEDLAHLGRLASRYH